MSRGTDRQSDRQTDRQTDKWESREQNFMWLLKFPWLNTVIWFLRFTCFYLSVYFNFTLLEVYKLNSTELCSINAIKSLTVLFSMKNNWNNFQIYICNNSDIDSSRNYKYFQPLDFHVPSFMAINALLHWRVVNETPWTEISIISS